MKTFTKSYLPLYALLAICIVPMIVATIFYYAYPRFHFSHINRGQLIAPAVHLSNEKYNHLNNHASERRWIVLQVVGENCDQDCQHRDFLLHQMQKLLGKNRQRIYIQQTKQMALAPHRIYLIDPAQNIFMSYPETIGPLDILHDLKRVLEVSQIG